VIPGCEKASLDVRHRFDEVRTRAVQMLTHGVARCEQHLDQPAMPLHTERMSKAVEAAGYPVHHMTSGAGHDAMILAPHVPSSMLFVRSPRGISHSPEETVREEDVEAAIAVGVACLTL
jgi:allantoate deiminase